MAPFYPITICRSDGQLEVITKTGVKELNQPTPAQLSDKEDAEGNVDCYKKLEYDEPKAVDWRRKIGGMLMHYLGGKEHSDRNYVLKDLPEGYVLWEHLKYNKNKLEAEQKREKGKHAAGAYERQDTYLYGHPQGRKKRYRSPADFFPHVLWLSTDKDGDPRNCSCKVCSPFGEDDPQEDTPKQDSGVVLKKEISKAAIPVVSIPQVKKEAKKDNMPIVSIPQKSVSASGSASGSASSASGSSKPSSQPISLIRSPEQRLDSDPNSGFIYRTGELVWFNRGHAWGLAVISKRRIENFTAQYLVQPLSHPITHPAAQINEQESIRPWLAWSVPQTTISAINNLPYDEVPWDRIIRGEYGGGDYQVDGSILAAKVIDGSYSLFDRIEKALVSPGEVHYNGMFLGAEKIWVGEPVRLRVEGDAIVVLVIQKLIERTVQPNPLLTVVTFVGDIYKFVEMPMPYSSRSQWPTPDLPARMVADLRFRNEVADNAKKRTWYEWQLLEPAARRGLADIKGRWYETRLLLPVLRGLEAYQLGIGRGETSDASLWMNGRGDTIGGTGKRQKNRRMTLGKSVPDDFKVGRGLDGPPADNLFPETTIPPPSVAIPDIDQFMDLDGVGNSSGYNV
ncbi:hypothetical protein SS1G_14092 [Sclerotinia sclerotiorum 1980 UF-70]|uniref:Cryptic loci regulator 2 N-terminal domain-containing protein n=2 Tax=Sclerotinia sclerotiorum (strain ATCC 18683 / 1980 / Ss-1) TaxID=665079 RepID=A7F911_SCLS1|nr:hypothetical protein SS1G_14092 [Sclerotinia sclerotiorum 1980 UF-70]APA13182.1 hypothetical protein sscle_10g079520 [Sclerotinia sclerotiorum 1980 UF-70]EDN99232.1 hypothetical protein SS1G_14092 [Sclerotinia sclerotiorum 1980 UF-70]